jgi:hypothetical protein
MPKLRSSSSMFSERDHSPAVLRNAVPRNVFPPERGMMFMVGPPVSFSPRPPEICTWISVTSVVLYTTLETPPPLNGAATVIPSILIRPSFAFPPLAVNSCISGVVSELIAIPTLIAGIICRIDE